MYDAVPDCLTTGYEELIDGLHLPDPTIATSSPRPSDPALKSATSRLTCSRPTTSKPKLPTCSSSTSSTSPRGPSSESSKRRPPRFGTHPWTSTSCSTDSHTPDCRVPSLPCAACRRELSMADASEHRKRKPTGGRSSNRSTLKQHRVVTSGVTPSASLTPGFQPEGQSCSRTVRCQCPVRVSRSGTKCQGPVRRSVRSRGPDARKPWRMLPSTRAFLVAGAGFEPATFGL
jgi:hypothetical protein